MTTPTFRFRRSALLMLAGAALTGIAGCGSEPAKQAAVAEATSNSVAPVTLTAADPAVTGKAAAAACRVCHAVDAGAPTVIGPNLHGVVGRKAGSLAGFAYSHAMKTSGLTWTDAELDAFIANPAAKVPGTAMGYPGMPDAATRSAIIAYLNGISPK